MNNAMADLVTAVRGARVSVVYNGPVKNHFGCPADTRESARTGRVVLALAPRASWGGLSLEKRAGLVHEAAHAVYWQESGQCPDDHDERPINEDGRRFCTIERTLAKLLGADVYAYVCNEQRERKTWE